MLRRLQFSSTILILLSSCCLSSAQMMVSSTIVLAQWQPSIIASDLAHHLSDEALTRLYWNLPCGGRKNVRWDDSLSRARWK